MQTKHLFIAYCICIFHEYTRLCYYQFGEKCRRKTNAQFMNFGIIWKPHVLSASDLRKRMRSKIITSGKCFVILLSMYFRFLFMRNRVFFSVKIIYFCFEKVAGAHFLSIRRYRRPPVLLENTDTYKKLVAFPVNNELNTLESSISKCMTHQH